MLLLVPIIWIWLRNRVHHADMRVTTLASFPKEISIRASINQWLPTTLRLLTFLMLIIALARPQLIYSEEEIDAEGIDIIISMDLSSSMLSEDFEPNRLTVSQQLASEFISERTYDRIGLTAFAAESFTKCPLTTDHRVIRQFLQELECGILIDGTAIGMGLASSVKALANSEAKSKVIILLTDGENNAGYIQPMTAVEMAKTFNIKVYTIGVGSTTEARTPIDRLSDGTYDFDYRLVRIDEKLLQEIAEKTSGKYFRATDANSLKKVYNEIDQLEKTKMEIEVVEKQSEAFFIFLLLAIIFLSLEIVLRYTVFRTVT